MNLFGGLPNATAGIAAVGDVSYWVMDRVKGSFACG
jgi:hypothetical protein